MQLRVATTASVCLSRHSSQLRSCLSSTFYFRSYSSVPRHRAMKAVTFHSIGGPEVLKYEEVPVPVPKDDEVLVRQHACGVNFVDIYHRTGLYGKGIPFPRIGGREGAGVVERVGGKVSLLRVGDRVAYALVENTYAELAAVPEWRAVRVPDQIELSMACAVMLQGLTAHFLSSTTYPLKPGSTALVLAAAGGVGQLLVQMAKLRGARVIATVSSAAKAEIVRGLGADHVILYTEQHIDEAVKRITDGRGVEVAYDSVGAATYQQSMKSLAPLGYLVLFGNASGPVPPIDPMTLSASGSLFLTRPTLGNYVSNAEILKSRTKEMFDWMLANKLRVSPPTILPLSQAAEGQRLLESGKSTGKVVLVPDALLKK